MRTQLTWGFLGMVTAVGIAVAFGISPIPQDPTYHEFADQRTLFGIPNFWNVVSSLLFTLAGFFGLSKLFRLQSYPYHSAYLVFCIGMIFVGIGSVYYHYAPSTPTLVWDRLPMTISFMAFFSMVVHDRISERFGRKILWPLVLVGVASVGYWYGSELQSRGDLRAYGLVQFLPMVLIPLMLIMSSGKRLSTPWLWTVLGTYTLAKVMEHSDEIIYRATSGVSGHSLKHLFAALAAIGIVLAVQRSPRTKT